MSKLRRHSHNLNFSQNSTAALVEINSISFCYKCVYDYFLRITIYYASACLSFLHWQFLIVFSVPSKPIITRAAVNAEELEQLIEEFCLFKSDTASELMRRNYVRHQQEQRRKMLAKLEDNNPQADNQVGSL